MMASGKSLDNTQGIFVEPTLGLLGLLVPRYGCFSPRDLPKIRRKTQGPISFGHLGQKLSNFP